MGYKRDFLFQIKIKDALKWGDVEDPWKKSDILNYTEAMRDLGNDNIAKGKARFNQLLKRKLYWLRDLRDIEYYVLYLYGYIKSNSRSKNKRLHVKNERGQFESVICLLPENEGMQHMRDKEYIASYNYDHVTTEYLIEESKNRIDVVFDHFGKRLGIEIQLSLMEFSRLKQKVSLLTHNFNYWYMILPKKYVEKYSYLDNSNGKVVTMNEAITKIKEFLAQKHPFFEEEE